MQHTYTYLDSNGVRYDTTTRLEEITDDAFKDGKSVELFDNTSMSSVAIFRSVDELMDWHEAKARRVWLDAADKAPQELAEARMLPTDPEVAQQVSIVIDKLTTDVNLKNAAGAKKPPVAHVPPVAILAMGAAMANGASKYLPFNWQSSEVSADVFYNAVMRHMLDWWGGEDFADDSNVHHLAHAMAGCAILLDGIATGRFDPTFRPQYKVAPTKNTIWLKNVK